MNSQMNRAAGTEHKCCMWIPCQGILCKVRQKIDCLIGEGLLQKGGKRECTRR